MKKAPPSWSLIIVLAIVKFILPFILQSPVYELQRDEYLYYLQGQHFDWGYMENPPLLSWLGMISSWLGGSEFWVRFWPSLFGALTLIVTCLIASEFGGRRFAQFLAGLCIITGAFMRVHALFQPNIVDIFFWTLTIYYIIRYINSSKSINLYLICLSLALGFLSKYSVVFVAASLVIALLISRHRRIFVEKKFYSAALISLLVILPNLLWQYSHNWPVLHHMQELQETQLRYLNPADFIKDQFLFILPAIFVWITGLVWLFKHRQWRFLFFTYFLVIIFLMLGRGKSYYSLGIYPVLLAAGAVSLENWSVRKLWFRYASVILIVGITLPFVPMLLPVWEPAKLAKFYKDNGAEKLGILKWEDQRDHPLPQDFADMLGWKELTDKTERFFHSMPTDVQTDILIYCRNYGQAGSLAYYGKDRNFSRRVISDNGSFLWWIPNRFGFRHLIFVGRKIPEKDDLVFQHFEKMTIIDSVTNPYSRQQGDKIIFFENIDSTGWRLAQESIQRRRSQFGR